jgi:hypothetical protein
MIVLQFAAPRVRARGARAAPNLVRSIGIRPKGSAAVVPAPTGGRPDPYEGARCLTLVFGGG